MSCVMHRVAGQVMRPRFNRVAVACSSSRVSGNCGSVCSQSVHLGPHLLEDLLGPSVCVMWRWLVQAIKKVLRELRQL